MGCRSIVAFACVWIVGCSSSDTDLGGMHFTTLLSRPAMMQTAVEPTVRPSLRINGTPVPAQPSELVLFHKDSSDAVAGAPRVFTDQFGGGFEFVPDAPLTDGWYTFEFKAWGAIGGHPDNPPILVSRPAGDVYDSYFEVGAQ